MRARRETLHREELKVINNRWVHGWFKAAALAAVLCGASLGTNAAVCRPSNTLTADVAALDIPMVFNRMGAQNVNWQMYALWDDLVRISDGERSPTPLAPIHGQRPTDKLDKKGALPYQDLAGKVTLRPDLRPRPLTLRVAAGDCLRVRFVNLLTSVSNPFKATQAVPYLGHPMAQRERLKPMDIDDQVASRVVGFHPQGLELVRSIDDDSSYVGKNRNSMVEPGGFAEYLFHAPHEGAFLVTNPGAVFGSDGTSGTAATGLFGVVAVQPKGARFYRGQVTEEELRAATVSITPHGQPVIDYEKRYQNDCGIRPGPWCLSKKVGRPILNMVDTRTRRIVHSDVNAIIVGPNRDGSFPPGTYPLERSGKRNPTLPNRLEPFREFVSVFHDENAVAQAFPRLFDHLDPREEDNPLDHTLHGVRDAFMINYGSGGVGAEVIANRLGVGPMHDCVDCAFEEFFLSSFTVGDPALLVDVPANNGLVETRPVKVSGTPDADLAKVGIGPDSLPKDAKLGPKANETYYPHDPANVHHSYLGDFVKFRNVHVGKEQHIFHLHNHQWLFNPNDDNSNYIDAQAIGPGSGYTYEIAFGGSGNRNRSAGDAVFHCHYYPHFAQGMWYLWRIHDTFEAGTRLEVSQSRQRTPYDLRSGKPAKGARALPDGEIVAGTPIPAVVPLPGKALAPMPGKVEVVANPRTSIHNGRPVGSLARVEKVPDPTKPEIAWMPKANPGYPFWIAGIEHTVGSRPPTPPRDMDPAAGGADGGLPRHTVEGYSAHSKADATFHRLSAVKHEKAVKPVYFPEEGTGVERFVMDWHAQKGHATSIVLPNRTVHPGLFRTNGAKPTPGAPFFDPCVDDRQQPLSKSKEGFFHNAMRDDRSMVERQQHSDLSGMPYFGQFGRSVFDAETPRVYKGANIQLDVTFNKLGQHYGQQRILALWQDVGDLLLKKQAPEPLVMRMNTFDCAVYLHTNLVPKEYQVDDYQISTPTDIIGQHIHLPKWDLPSADGSTNGWNYEDGTFAPGMVRSRIKAINAWNAAATARGERPVPRLDGSSSPLVPAEHSFFSGRQFAGSGPQDSLQKPADECIASWRAHHDSNRLDEWEKTEGLPRNCDWLGARTTIQRWFSDPVINKEHRHRGLGITFTHDHLGPSTHQQVGLYATMLSEPPNAVWRHNEKGHELYHGAGRHDGGPTSWQAVITGCRKHQGATAAKPKGDESKPCVDFGPLAIDAHKPEHAGAEDSHREFFLQFGDFQHAYQKGHHFGVDEKGAPKLPTPESFRVAVNPSVRKPASPNFPDIVHFEPTCPGSTGPFGVMPRPCPEVISADDVGMMVVNYRNEPIAARVYDPDRVAQSDGKKGTQAAYGKGDLAFAFQTRTDRKIEELNGVAGEVPSRSPPVPPVYEFGVDVNQGRKAGDPFTPILRAYSGDLVRIKIQAGSHEHEHNGTIHGLSWLQAGSGYGASPTSGWRNSQNSGLSEQFTLTASIVDYEPLNNLHLTDRLWSIDSSQDGLWNGAWGVLRTYSRKDVVRADLDEKDKGLADDPDDKDPNYVQKQKIWESQRVGDLLPLPQNPLPTLLSTRQQPGSGNGYTNDCGIGDGRDRVVRRYSVLAVLANQVLGNQLGAWIPDGVPGLNPKGGTLVYNHRKTTLSLVIRDDDGNQRTESYGVGPLHDPTAIMLVREEDYDVTSGKLKPGVPIEPLVLRARAGECVEVLLRNLLPEETFASPMPDLNGFTSLSHIVTREPGSAGSAMTGFNNNLIRPSHYIGLHPQLVHYDVSVSDGSAVGLNSPSLVPPGGARLYQWYAGKLHIPGGQLNACFKDAADPDGVFEDLNDLRNSSVGGFQRRASLDLTPSKDRRAALLQRLTKQLVEVRRILQTGEKSVSTTSVVDTLEAVQPGPRSRPDAATASTSAPEAPTGSEVEAELKEVQKLQTQLFQASGLQGCFDRIDQDEARQQAAERAALRAAYRADDQLWLNWGLDLELMFLEPDSAPLLERAQGFSRLDLVRQRKRAICSEQVQSSVKSQDLMRLLVNSMKSSLSTSSAEVGAKGLALALEATPAVQQTLGHLANSARDLVPGVDRDAFAETDNASPLAFGWRSSKYRQLTRKTTRVVELDAKACRFEGIELGGSNLTPPDRIKQGQKGAVGSLVVLPSRSIWSEMGDDTAFDHQRGAGSRRTRASASVQIDLGGDRRPPHARVAGFRDFVAVVQKGLNLRYGQVLADGEPMGAVSVLSAERADDEIGTAQVIGKVRAAPEDAHDSGHMAINYGTEPMWFRFGMPPDAPFGHGGKPSKPAGEGLGGTQYAWQAFSSDGCCSAGPDQPSTTAQRPTGEPAVPVFQVLHPGAQSRLRLVMPTGVGRGSVMHLHGHVWRRDPYLEGPGGVPSQCIGANALAMWLGGQESITPMAHFDLIFDSTGGAAAVPGDYLLRDQGGFGITNGLWSIVRNTENPLSPAALGKVMRRPLVTECRP